MTNSRVARGRATQEMVAAWFREHGAPNAKSRAASLPGIDVYDIPGLAPEVKATPGDITGALRQAVKNGHGQGLPFVVWRPNGYGPERITQWPVIFTLAGATALLYEAGYLNGE